MSTVHSEEGDICEPCVFRTVQQMLDDRGYVSAIDPPLPLPGATVAHVMMVNENNNTTDMTQSLWNIGHEQKVVVMFFAVAVSVDLAREVVLYQETHAINRMIVVVMLTSGTKITPQAAVMFNQNEIEMFECRDLRTNRHRNALVPKITVMSPDEAKLLPDNQKATIWATDVQCRYLRPPLGAVLKMSIKNGQTQPKVLYRKVEAKRTR